MSESPTAVARRAWALDAFVGKYGRGGQWSVAEVFIPARPIGGASWAALQQNSPTPPGVAAIHAGRSQAAVVADCSAGVEAGAAIHWAPLQRLPVQPRRRCGTAALRASRSGPATAPTHSQLLPSPRRQPVGTHCSPAGGRCARRAAGQRALAKGGWPVTRRPCLSARWPAWAAEALLIRNPMPVGGPNCCATGPRQAAPPGPVSCGLHSHAPAWLGAPLRNRWARGRPCG
jgi:hypothetical protein